MIACGPKILGGGGDLQIVFLLENECSLSGVDNHRWWGHSNPTTWLKKELSGGGYEKTLRFSLAP